MSNIALSPKAAKLMKLCDLEGHTRFYDLLRTSTPDSLCPAICMTEGCDNTQSQPAMRQQQQMSPLHRTGDCRRIGPVYLIVGNFAVRMVAERTGKSTNAQIFGAGLLGGRNQSRYLAGLVSGIASHSNAVAIAEAAARIRNPSQLPSASKRNPVAVVLIEAAMAIRVPMAPRTKLNRPVPVVRSVITRIVSTVTAAALMPPSN
jgi:hypothetical protein